VRVFCLAGRLAFDGTGVESWFVVYDTGRWLRRFACGAGEQGRRRAENLAALLRQGGPS
jgi:hypothetical protein